MRVSPIVGYRTSCKETSTTLDEAKHGTFLQIRIQEFQ
jgi:hypothetical protein